MYLPVGITEEEAREKEIELREREVKVSEKSLFWERVQTFGIAVVPILAFLGIDFARRRRS